MRASALVGTTAAFGALGPPLGSAIAIIFGIFLSVPQTRHFGDLILGLLPLLLAIQPIAYMVGVVPALIVGLVLALLAHWAPSVVMGALWRRALASCIVGTVVDVVWQSYTSHPFAAAYYLPLIALSDGLVIAVIAGVSAGILGSVFPLRDWLSVAAHSNARRSGP